MKIHYLIPPALCIGNLCAQQTDGTLEPTTVTANRFEEKKSEINAAVSLIDDQRFNLFQPQTFDGLFRFEPNVDFLGGPRVTGEQLQIRGQGGNAVTVRIDDARQNFVSGHAGQRFFIDPLFLKRAEIIRGAKSHLYGSGAAGVVNLRTYNPGDFLNENSSFGGKLHTAHHSVNDQQVYSGLFALGNERTSFLVGFVDRSGNDIELGNGLSSEGSAIDQEGYMLKFDFSPNDEHKFLLGYHYYESLDTNGANPQGSVNLSNALVDREINYNQLTFSHHWNPADNDLLEMKTNLYYNRTKQIRDYRATSGSNLGRVNEHILKTYGIDFSNRSTYSAFGAQNTLIAGFEYFMDDQIGKESRATFNSGGIPGTSSGRPDADSENFAFFLENTSDFQNGLKLTVGLRYDSYKTDGRTVSQSGSELSPHIALRYEIQEGIAIFADYAHAFTAPTLNQIYQDGSHFGVVPTSFFPSTEYFEEVFVPNEDLEAESSQNFELGIDINRQTTHGDFEAKLVGFYQKGKNTYDSEIVGMQVTPGYFGFAGPGTLTQAFRQEVNRSETTIYGVELDMQYTTECWYARAAFSHLEGEDDDTGDKLNTITGDKLYFEFGYTPTDNLTLGANALIVGSRKDKVNDPTLQTGSYDIYGLFASWKYNDSLSFTAGVDNLFDEEYERNSVLNTEAGRNFYLSASYSF